MIYDVKSFVKQDFAQEKAAILIWRHLEAYGFIYPSQSLRQSVRIGRFAHKWVVLASESE